MASLDVPFPAGCFPELVQPVAREADMDAERVHLFLQELDENLSRRGLETLPRSLPGWLLLGLGAALRILAWESNGICSHLPADLPLARQAIRDLFSAAGQPARLEELARGLSMRVLDVWVQHLAWQGRAALGADVVLGEAAEDDLVDALAGFLWANRHALDGEAGEGR